MRLRQIIGILVILAGVALLFVSYYITDQVLEGKAKISQAESQVNTGKNILGLTPYSKQIGDQVIFNPAQQKIAAGKDEVARYEALASKAKIGGIILIVVGIGIFIIPFNRKKK